MNTLSALRIKFPGKTVYVVGRNRGIFFDIVWAIELNWVSREMAAREGLVSEAAQKPGGGAVEDLPRTAASTVRFYDALSIGFFVAAAVSLAFLSLYLVTDFVVIALGAMDIGTILNAASRMIALRGISGEGRLKKARSTVRLFHVISYACYALAFGVFVVAVLNLATDFGVMGLELTGCGTILMAISRSIQLESLI